MKIALVGYGRMGKTIETLAKEKGFEVALILDQADWEDISLDQLKNIDVAIEFTQPESAFRNIKALLEAGIPVISGTTGWLEQKPAIDKIVAEQQGAFLYASNFSVGMNIFFALNRQLAKMMGDHPDYKVLIEEIHHTTKQDAPSGTAITLAEGILDNLDHKTSWVNDESSEREEIPILSIRKDPAPGTHVVHYQSFIDDISIRHEAHTRAGFAQGALLAAQWIQGKRGVFGMQDMLGI